MRSMAIRLAAAATCCTTAMAAGREPERTVIFRCEATAGVAVASLGSSPFSASGSSGGRSTAVAVDGAAIGLDRAQLTSVGMHLQFGLAPHVALGVTVSALWRNVELGGGVAASEFGSSMSGVAAGPELSTLWHFKWIELRGSLAFGDRTLWLPVVALDSVSCNSRNYPWFRCDVKASSSNFFLEPRLTVGFLPIPVLSFGAYVGGDVMPSGGWSAGAFVAASTSGWQGAHR
jgi:hypothetical protein